MRSSLVEDRQIRSVEIPIDESSSQHGPTTFGSLDDLESFISSLPSTKDIYNLFDSGIDKISSKGKEIFHLEDETNDELFNYTPLNDGTPDSVTARQDPGTMLKEANNVLKFLANSPTNVSHFYDMKDFIFKSQELALLGENRLLAYEARLEVTRSQLESLNEEHGKLVQDISSMKKSLNVLDREINNQKLHAMKTKLDELKSSANHALAKEKVHSEDLEKLKKAVEALKNQLLL
ncbi:hypothetical protein ACH5RR_001201 [Cinchona calisaya]|uniref:Uncharacterized protein n=1 Tax=Cinchona calisaya TaxID=153742 RepID=A0ABD3B2T0_9GENT